MAKNSGSQSLESRTHMSTQGVEIEAGRSGYEDGDAWGKGSVDARKMGRWNRCQSERCRGYRRTPSAGCGRRATHADMRLHTSPTTDHVQRIGHCCQGGGRSRVERWGLEVYKG